MWQFRCIIKDKTGKILTSKVAVMDIVENPESGKILEAPQSVTAKKFQEVTFTVKAENMKTYQWQYSPNGRSWYNVNKEGATTDALTVTVYSDYDQRQFRCVFTDNTGRYMVSEAATITLATAITAEAIQDVTAKAYKNAVIAVEAEGDGLKFCWQYSDNGASWYNIKHASGTTDTLDLPVYKNNKQSA